MLNVRTRQRLGYTTLLALSAATALLLYPVVHKPAVLLHRAEVLTRQGKTVEADALISQAVEAGSRTPDSVLRAANILLDADQAPEAVDLLQKTLAHSRPIPIGLAGRMAGLLDTYGLTDEALAVLQKTEPARRNREERLHLADLLRRHEHYVEALAEYDAMLQNDPADTEATLRKAETLSWKGDPNAALPLLRELVRTEPENRPARLLLARALYWSGHVDEAEAEYKRLLGEQQ